MNPAPFIILVIAVLIVILAVLYLRFRRMQMSHHEHMAALEKGLPISIEQTIPSWSPRVYFLRGLLWTFVGTALIIGLLTISATNRHYTSSEEMHFRANNLAMMLRISQDEAMKIVEKDRNDHPYGMPWGIALLGLIPVGVGLAYLIFYQTDSVRSKEDVRHKIINQ